MIEALDPSVPLFPSPLPVEEYAPGGLLSYPGEAGLSDWLTLSGSDHLKSAAYLLWCLSKILSSKIGNFSSNSSMLFELISDQVTCMSSDISCRRLKSSFDTLLQLLQPPIQIQTARTALILFGT